MKDTWLIIFGTFFLILVSTLFLPWQEKPVLQESVVESYSVVLSKEVITPKRIFSDPQPKLSAQSALAVDFETGTVLFEKDPHLKFPPASLTKLATALVALENCSKDEQIKVAKVQQNGAQMGLETGDVVSVSSLIYGLLLPSGNDAAEALARGCTGSIEQFNYSLNQKIDTLGMKDTHFTNPSGLEGGKHYSNASDLMLLARAALSDPFIGEVVKTKEKTVFDVSGKKKYDLRNLNKLLFENGVFGVKTGSGSFGENLILGNEHDSHKIMLVVLGSKDRFNDSKVLSDWIFRSYRWTY